VKVNIESFDPKKVQLKKEKIENKYLQELKNELKNYN